MKTDCEFKKEHAGHKDGCCFDTGFTPSGTARAKCHGCGTIEVVEKTNKICEKHSYGQHIPISCKKCGAMGTTKNISCIGARTLFIGCEHYSEMEHICA